MTLSPDEQPLTRRQLRELEKQMPRKERQNAAKAAEEADAARRAAQEDATVAPTADETAANEAAAREAGPAAEAAPEETTTADGTPTGEEAAEEQRADDEGDDDAALEGSIPPVPAPKSANSEVVEDAVVVEEPERVSPFAPRSASSASSTPAWSVPTVSVPASAEAVSAETAPDAETGEADSASADENHDEAKQQVVEELIIDDVPVDDDPDDEETEITIEPAPSGPLLAPIFQAPVEREVPPVPSSDDSDASFDDLISSRGVGSTNSSTTSALVLPAVPNSTDMGTALDETGEVIITGSIDLPSSMGASGAPAEGIESNDLDSILERGESENVDGDVAPVSASRAISTSGMTSALVTPPKRGRANVPIILAITAAVLAVGVIGLLIAAFIFHAF